MNERDSFLERLGLYIDSPDLVDVLRTDLGLSSATMPTRLNAQEMLDHTLREVEDRALPGFPPHVRMMHAAQRRYPRAPSRFEQSAAADGTLRQRLVARWPEAQEALAIVRTVLPLEGLRTTSALILWHDAIREARKLGLRDALVKLVETESP